jgi:hypothetical protein
MTFSTREIAIGIWVLLAAVWILSKPSIWPPLREVVRAALEPKLVVPFILLALYVWGIVQLLAAVHLWDSSLLKDTILWFVFSGVAIAFSAVDFSNKPASWPRIVRDQIKVVIVVEYLVNAYTFPLWVELLLVPLLVFLGLISAVSNSKPEYKPAAKLVDSTIAIVGLAILGFAVASAIADRGNFDFRQAAESIALSPLLSLAALPFMYVFSLCSAYEQLFLRFRIGQPRPPAVIRYAKLRLFRHLGLRPAAVWAFTRQNAWTLVQARDTSAIDRLLDEHSPKTSTT